MNRRQNFFSLLCTWQIKHKCCPKHVMTLDRDGFILKFTENFVIIVICLCFPITCGCCIFPEVVGFIVFGSLCFINRLFHGKHSHLNKQQTECQINSTLIENPLTLRIPKLERLEAYKQRITLLERQFLFAVICI